MVLPLDTCVIANSFLCFFSVVCSHTTHTLQVCLFCSAGYHMFNCQSEMVHKRWFSLDLMGVSVGLIGCYFPGAYYAFHCHLVREVAWVGSGCVCVCHYCENHYG